MRKRTTGYGLMAALALTLLITQQGLGAKRVIGNWYSDDRSYFEGDCTATDDVTLTLPRGAFHIRPVTPKTGDGLRELDYPDVVAANITDVLVGRVGSRLIVTWKATGTPAVCGGPFTKEGWLTRRVDFRVNYLRRERLYFPSTCRAPKYKPKRIIVACADVGLYLTSMRWRGWNTTVAKGSGTAHANDCIPYCAVGHFHTNPAKVRRYRAGFCADEGVYQYRRLRITFPGPTPGGPRSYSVRFPCSVSQP
jgi:hypothetical protein